MENSQQPTGQSAPSAPAPASTGAGHSHAHTSSAHSHAGGPRRSFGQRGGGRGGFRHGGGHGGHGGRSGSSSGGSSSGSGTRSSRVRDRGMTSREPRLFTSKLAARKDEDSVSIPPLAPGDIRIIPIGGVEQIGQNMTMIEYGDDIVVIDAGFQFKEDFTPGIDYILPNTKYLEERKHKVKAIIITHGHLDHIGGIPYVMERIGNPPMYSRNLTTIMIKKRQEEFPHLAPIDYKIVEKDEVVTVGAFRIKFFSVTHTIPDSMGVIVETPHGSIVHTGDLKVDHIDGVPTEAEQNEYKKFEKEKVLFLMMDSTNVELPGFSTPERVVHKNIEEIIRNAKGRLIVALFASLLERMMKIIEIAEAHNKKVVIDGRSMKNNIEIVKNLGLLKAKKETIISIDEMENYPPDRIIALVTGAQGDEFTALMRMAMKDHKYFKISSRDTILLSSSVVPGNERNVQKLKDNLSRQGAKIIHYRTADVHASGHANREESSWIQRQIKPRFFMPVHGYHYMLRVHADIALSLGMSEDQIIVPDNGSVIEIRENGTKLVRLREKAPSSIVMVDGFAVGEIQEVVIRDRQMLSQDGMFVIVAIVNASTGKLKKSPDLISRGFVYLRESQDLLHDARFIIKKTIEESAAGQNPINFDFVKNNVTDAISKYLFQKTAKRPIVIPVILGI